MTQELEHRDYQQDDEFARKYPKLRGNFYRIPAEEEALMCDMAVNYCFQLTSRRLKLHEIVTRTAWALLDEQNCEDIFNEDLPPVMIIGVGDLGLEQAGYEATANHGEFTGTWNVRGNDRDLIIATRRPFSAFRKAAEQATSEVGQKYCNPQNPKYFPHARLNPTELNESNFNIPPYIVVTYNYDNFDESDGRHRSMDLHYQDMTVQPDVLAKLLADYSPWYSNRFGMPTYFAVFAENGNLNEYVWQPFEVEPAPRHEVSLSAPELFVQDERCCLQAIRVAAGCIIASLEANEPAVISDSSLAVLKEGLNKHIGRLSAEQRTNIVERFHSCLDTVTSLAKLTQNHWDKDKYQLFERNGLPDPVTYFLKLLDQMGFGEQFWGESVEEHMKNVDMVTSKLFTPANKIQSEIPATP